MKEPGGEEQLDQIQASACTERPKKGGKAIASAEKNGKNNPLRAERRTAPRRRHEPL